MAKEPGHVYRTVDRLMILPMLNRDIDIETLQRQIEKAKPFGFTDKACIDLNGNIYEEIK